MGEIMDVKESQINRTILTQVNGWIPLIDHLVDKYGVLTAAVWGRMWRYSQMRSGVCRASLPTIAADLRISRMTVRRAVIRLCNDGYLLDLTPNNVGRVHVYRDTGKVTIASKFQVETVEEQPLSELEGSSMDADKPLSELEGTLSELEGYPSHNVTGPLSQSATNHKTLLKENMNHNSKYWRILKDQLRHEMPKSAFDKFISPTHCLSCYNGVMVLEAPDEYTARWIAERLISTLVRQLTGILNQTADIVVTSKEIPHA